ncbi:MAG: O-antigen ligase family protein [Clostridia bacterium]|nr:O-antigen ligase family protein [Clostridia bacterium]
MIKKINFKKILDIFIVILLLITCIKKGGFYKEDVITINLVVTAIGIVYLALNTINNKKTSISMGSIFLFLLGIAYFLPILVGNSTDISDSIFEMIRYFNLYIIYKIVSNSDNHSIYENGIIIITTIECLIGIDGIGQRYLTRILNFFSSGYLSKDLTRMSGTIQYANVFAMFCVISLFLLLFKILKEKKYNFIKVTLFSFIFSSLILTESRAMLVIFFAFLLYYFISSYRKSQENINEAIIIISINILLCIIGAALVYNFAMSNAKVYLFTLLFLVFNVVINFILYRYCTNIFSKLSMKKVTITFILSIMIYGVLAVNISIPLYMSEDLNHHVTKRLYHINGNDVNHIKFKVDENEVDTRYKIKFFEVLDDLEVIEIKEVGYYSSSTGNFEFDFELDENVKYINITIECEKGNMTLKDMELNGKKIRLNYLFIPSSILEKIEDLLNHSTSISDRVTFSKDALKIIFSSTKNFVFGIGGEGFKNAYELYQTEKYISTEVHNSFLQIFVESGMIGFSCVISIIIYTFVKCKNKEKKILLFIFIIHSFIDLELSYFLMIFLFGILLGTCKNESKFSVSSYIYFPLNIIMILLFIILFKANLAYGMSIPDTSSTDKIKAMEQRVILDQYDSNYRIELNNEYEKYLKILLKEYTTSENKELEREIENVLLSIKKNSNCMMKNSNYNKYVIINIINIYFNNLEYFVELDYGNEKEKGYEEYMNAILSYIESLEDHQYNEIAISKVQELYENYYTKIKEKNKLLNSIKLQEYIDILDKKRNSIL